MQLAPSTRRLLAAGLGGMCLLLAGTPVFAGPATDRLREFFGRVNVVLDDPATRSQPLEKVVRVKRLVTEIADVRGAAAETLEHVWEARTPAERDEFTRLFAELLERGLVARLAATVSPVNGMVMSWRGETHLVDEARVLTVVESRDGRKINVEYRMIERRGRWLVRDVVVDGVSTIENYRSQFKRVLRQGDYAGLVAQLRAKLGEETLMFAQASLPPSAASSTKPAETVAAVRPASPRVTPARVATHPPAAAPVKAIAPVAVIKPSVAVIKPPVAVIKPPVAVIKPPVAVIKPPVAATTKSVSSVAATSTSNTTPMARRVAMVTVTKPAATIDRAAIAPIVPPAADVLSPVGVVDITTHLLPSVLLIMLGFGGVSGVVFLRRRASASALVLQRLRDGDKRLVLMHPVAGVAKVRESRRKRRVVPTPRNPARHIDDAHGA
jgi:phospholipid transport system substrate-binding protein